MDFAGIGPDSCRTARVVLACALGLACSAGRQQQDGAGATPVTAEQGASAAVARARADSARKPYTAADIRFMSAMIPHHAQAIRMARWAPTHGASHSIRTLAERIINAQEDEITTMQTWLRDRRQPVPDPTAADTAGHHGGHDMSVHGMLSDAQLRQLEAAQGREFDRLFLTFMIQHHRGAVSMVKDLFASPGAAHDDTVFKLASEIEAEQTTEIDRMQKMLASLTLGIEIR